MAAKRFRRFRRRRSRRGHACGDGRGDARRAGGNRSDRIFAGLQLDAHWQPSRQRARGKQHALGHRRTDRQHGGRPISTLTLTSTSSSPGIDHCGHAQRLDQRRDHQGHDQQAAIRSTAAMAATRSVVVRWPTLSMAATGTTRSSANGADLLTGGLGTDEFRYPGQPTRSGLGAAADTRSPITRSAPTSSPLA